MKLKRFFAVYLSALLILALTPDFTQSGESSSVEKQKPAESIVDASQVFIEIQVYIQKYYYRGVDVKECWDNVLTGGLTKCLDPNSSYLSPSDVSLFNSETSGTFFGIGAELSQDKDGRTVVVSSIEGTPAWHAGLATGD